MSKPIEDSTLSEIILTHLAPWESAIQSIQQISPPIANAMLNGVYGLRNGLMAVEHQRVAAIMAGLGPGATAVRAVCRFRGEEIPALEYKSLSAEPLTLQWARNAIGLCWWPIRQLFAAEQLLLPSGWRVAGTLLIYEQLRAPQMFSDQITVDMNTTSGPNTFSHQHAVIAHYENDESMGVNPAQHVQGPEYFDWLKHQVKQFHVVNKIGLEHVTTPDPSYNREWLSELVERIRVEVEIEEHLKGRYDNRSYYLDSYGGWEIGGWDAVHYPTGTPFQYSVWVSHKTELFDGKTQLAERVVVRRTNLANAFGSVYGRDLTEVNLQFENLPYYIQNQIVTELEERYRAHALKLVEEIKERNARTDL